MLGDIIEPAAASGCPFHHDAGNSRGLAADDVLVLSMRKRMVVQYADGPSGGRELNLFYGDKEICFDEPELFAFGETLAAQSRFRAGDAAAWGTGTSWTTVKELLEQLLAEGILEHANDTVPSPILPGSMVRSSPLPAAACQQPRTWRDSESITGELTGRAVETGYLELFVPVFRVAHIFLDADGRQVGEANVFPRALRLDRPTTWVTCAYEGTRYMSERPMNVTALKTMRLHWRQMMAAAAVIRAAYLRRFPDAAGGWTVGRVERLATMVLAVPTYQLVRCDGATGNGDLHPALSSLFRVTDGLRMVMHQMLFVPVGEPTRSPDMSVTSEQIFEYAERNYSFHSETGVCAGPKHMIQELFAVLLDGRRSGDDHPVQFDAPVAAALDDIDAAFDYGLLGLQAYAAFFCLWPGMTRTYERLAAAAEQAVAEGRLSFAAFSARMRSRVAAMKASTFLATDEWRLHRERVYGDMYEECGRGLSTSHAAPGLADQIAPVAGSEHAVLASRLSELLAARFGVSAGDPAAEAHIAALRDCLMEFFLQTQAILCAATAVQQRINALLRRPEPSRPFGSAEADVHNLLQGAEVRRLPYLLDELEEALGIVVTIDAGRIELAARPLTAAATH